MNCRHWQDCGVRGGGCCALNLFGGKPSEGTCGRCQQREPIPDWKPGDKLRGAGDVVETITRKTGIAAAVKKLTRGKCGCGKRQATLNRMLPL